MFNMKSTNSIEANNRKRELTRLRQKKWRDKHKDEAIKRVNDWWTNSKINRAKYMRNWRASHPDYVKNYNNAHYLRTIDYYLKFLPKNTNSNKLMNVLEEHYKNLLNIRPPRIRPPRKIVEIKLKWLKYLQKRDRVVIRRNLRLSYILGIVTTELSKNNKTFRKKLHNLKDRYIKKVKSLKNLNEDVKNNINLEGLSPITYKKIRELGPKRYLPRILELENTSKKLKNHPSISEIIKNRGNKIGQEMGIKPKSKEDYYTKLFMKLVLDKGYFLGFTIDNKNEPKFWRINPDVPPPKDWNPEDWKKDLKQSTFEDVNFKVKFILNLLD